MKRIALIAAMLLVTVSIFAASRLSVSPSQMKDGETKTLVDGDKTITVTKHGENVDVKIEGAGKTRTISITNAGSGDVIIDRDGYRFRGLDHLDRLEHMDIVMPKIMIDRKEIERHLPKMQSVYVCPKDHTVLRVPEDKGDQTFKCPVDGTTMEKKTTRAFTFSLNDGALDELSVP